MLGDLREFQALLCLLYAFSRILLQLFRGRKYVGAYNGQGPSPPLTPHFLIIDLGTYQLSGSLCKCVVNNGANFWHDLLRQEKVQYCDRSFWF